MSLRRQITRNNHYVPQAVLRRWSVDGSHVYAYRTLVADGRVPDWLRMPVRGVAFHRDLYTQATGSGDVDAFERMVAQKYETPGLRSIDRLLAGDRLAPADWRNVGYFVACQDVRTPASLVEHIQQWHQDLPEFISETMQSSIDELEAAVRGGPPVVTHEASGDAFRGVMRVQVERVPLEKGGGALVRGEVTVGRALWIATMLHVLSSAARVFEGHRWGVFEPYDDGEWPLTDRPVLKLNWAGPEAYDLKGGWGNPKGDIMMPLSPRKLLHVEVGRRCTGKKQVMPKELTALTRKYLCENAFRWIFATKPTSEFAVRRPRIVNRSSFEQEESEWLEWHRDQSDSELS